MKQLKDGGRKFMLIDEYLVEFRLIDGKLIEWAKSDEIFIPVTKCYPINYTNYFIVKSEGYFSLYKSENGFIISCWDNECDLNNYINDIEDVIFEHGKNTIVNIGGFISKINPLDLSLTRVNTQRVGQFNMSQNMKYPMLII